MQFNREGVQNVKNWCYKVGGLSPFSILIFRTLASGSVLDSNLDLNIYIYIGWHSVTNSPMAVDNAKPKSIQAQECKALSG